MSFSDFDENGDLVDRDGSPSPYWLTNSIGSLAEERRQSSRNKSFAYNRQVSKARRYFNSTFSLLNLISSTENFNIKLSELEASYPSLTFQFQTNIQEVTKSNGRLLRSFLIFWYQQENVEEWIKFYVEESLDKILSIERFQPDNKIFKENLIIRQTFLILGKDIGLELLKEVYSEQNLKRWSETGKNLCKNHQVVKIPLFVVKEKMRRRGYKESSSNKHISKNQEGEVRMSEESRELEETRRRILAKQAKLFEERLDRYLQLESKEISSQKKREIFNSLLSPDSQKEEENS